MNKAYSNKALPPGTVLREWRLEEVLGVGGFGIVYKARGIYFNELVAIKEYFPSAISERVEDATVVPIDSDAQEVHALGLKKFVEEAKLLWNLSTPTRHPNIVSVRSLFEIHGTAYMVMDFEDGMSLSRLLKEGRRFNEASLMTLIRPIAEGLERAHRVGVLHRDIKPPNILVNADGRSVLIDFGSARFESGEATSTKVTFHTPPYAALEQYVKTYEQGPWTDIYALGVVFYECVTGQKPPEVLERLHGGLGTPLAGGDWPGYSRKFLAAIDAAMATRPAERPQSISQWLELFDAEDDEAALPPPPPAPEVDDEATRVVAFVSEEIVPVAPLPQGFAAVEKVETAVPDDTGAVTFKGAGQETAASRKTADVPPPLSAATPSADKGKPPAGGKPPRQPAAKRDARPGTPAGQRSGPPRAVLTGGAALLAILGVGGWYLAGRSGPVTPAPASAPPAEVPAAVASATVTLPAGTDPAAALGALLGQAKAGGAPAAAVGKLAEASVQLAAMQQQLPALQGAAAAARQQEIGAAAASAASAFAAALAADAAARTAALGRDQPWADPRRAMPSGLPPARQRAAIEVRQAFARLQGAVRAAATAGEPVPTIAAAQTALAASASYGGALRRAYRAPAAGAQMAETASPSAAPAAAPETRATPTETSDARVGQASKLFPDKYRTFNGVLNSARGTAQTVIRLADGAEPPGSAPKETRDAYRIRQGNAATARNYLNYLATLENSMRGDRSAEDVNKLISSANDTQRYLRQLEASSKANRN